MSELTDPLLVINFKTYLESTGKRAVELSKKIETVGKTEGVKVAVAPQFCDLEKVATSVSIPVYAQHVDAVAAGAFTGHVLPESVKATGAEGTLINHSERQILLRDIDKVVERARSAGLTTVVCAGTSKQAGAVSSLDADMVAIEPPELIGSGRAVSKENPEIIKDSVRKIRMVNQKVRILCGAGITTGDDVYAALQLGSQGFLIASGVVKAPKPEDVMVDFCKAVRRFG
ncbi:MAG TPA: triose-phosphate isomerase [Candidatus Acidoferrales bacterium]|nr:triose-phosphate isomerase [Candidatus Acidoferrales bacterium]